MTKYYGVLDDDDFRREEVVSLGKGNEEISSKNSEEKDVKKKIKYELYRGKDDVNFSNNEYKIDGESMYRGCEDEIFGSNDENNSPLSVSRPPTWSKSVLKSTPQKEKLKIKVPPTSLTSFSERLESSSTHCFSLSSTKVVSNLIAMLQGVEVLCHLSIMYLYKDDFLINPATLSLILGCLQIPWTIKPLWALMSDNLPIFGYRRKSYIIIGSFLCMVSTLSMGLFAYKSAFLTSFFLFLYYVGSAICNVIGEALVVEEGRRAVVAESAIDTDTNTTLTSSHSSSSKIAKHDLNRTGDVNMSTNDVSTTRINSTLFEDTVKSEVTDTNALTRKIMMSNNMTNDDNSGTEIGDKCTKKKKNKTPITMKTDSINEISTNKNRIVDIVTFNEENEKENDKLVTQVKENDDEQKKSIHHTAKSVSTFFAFRKLSFATMSYLSGFLLTYMTKQHVFLIAVNLPLCVFLSAFVLKEEKVTSLPPFTEQLRLLVSVLKRPELRNSALFIFLMMATPSAGATMFYFMTNELKFGPELLGRMALFQSIASLVGIVTYMFFFSTASLRKLLLWSTLLILPFCLLPIIVVQRWNLIIGIPDSAFVVTDTVMMEFVAEFQSMPILVLAARLCPVGLESTIYSFLLSACNLGLGLGSLLSAGLTSAFGITSKNFDNLTALIIVCVCTSLLPLCIIRLVPDSTSLKKGDNLSTGIEKVKEKTKVENVSSKKKTTVMMRDDTHGNDGKPLLFDSDNSTIDTDREVLHDPSDVDVKNDAKQRNILSCFGILHAMKNNDSSKGKRKLNEKDIINAKNENESTNSSATIINTTNFDTATTRYDDNYIIDEVESSSFLTSDDDNNDSTESVQSTCYRKNGPVYHNQNSLF